MSSMNLELKNKAKVMAAFKGAPDDLARTIQDSLAKTAGETVGKVKTIISTGRGMYKPPVDTGMMMRNVSIVEQAPLRITIAPSLSVTPYALFVHQGTKSMPARPFLEITKDTEQKNLQAFFSRALDNFVRDLANKID